MPSKREGVLTWSESSAELECPAGFIDALVPHRRLRINRGRHAGEIHSHVVRLPSDSAEIVDFEHLFDLETVVLQFRGNRGFSHNEGRVDVSSHRINVQNDVDCFALRQVEGTRGKRPSLVPAANSVSYVAHACETREAHAPGLVARQLNVLSGVSFGDRVDEDPQRHDLARHRSVVRVPQLDGNRPWRARLVLFLHVLWGSKDTGHRVVGLPLIVRRRGGDRRMPGGQFVAAGRLLRARLPRKTRQEHAGGKRNRRWRRLGSRHPTYAFFRMAPPQFLQNAASFSFEAPQPGHSSRAVLAGTGPVAVGSTAVGGDETRLPLPSTYSRARRSASARSGSMSSSRRLIMAFASSRHLAARLC